MRQPVMENLLVEGERIRIRPLVREDARKAFPLVHGRREVLDWLIWQGPDDLADLEEAYGSWRVTSENGANYHFAVDELETDRLIGTAGLSFMDHPFVGTVGYWLGAEHWGKGYGTELVQLVARLAFEHLATTVLTAEVFGGNRASERILEKSGFQRTEAPRTRALPPSPGANPDRTDLVRWLYTLTPSAYRASDAGPRITREDVRIVPEPEP